MDDYTDFIKTNLSKPIVLVGMMGAGKTHIGRLLAKNLELEFHDSDSLIEEKAGMPVPEIFEVFGEDKFRSSEELTILDLLEKPPCVIATGGGAVMNEAVLKALQERSISLWLDADIEDIYERIKDHKNRPLLQTENPKETLRILMEERRALYEKAAITVTTKPG